VTGALFYGGRMSEILLYDTSAGVKMIKGFSCRVHGGPAFYAKTMKEKDLPRCPSCGALICPSCANAYATDPKTADQAKQYLESCDGVSGAAWCGTCGDYGREFMLAFLKMVGCELPKDDKKPEAVMPRLLVTASLSTLPDINQIASAACEKFMAGSRAMQTIPHASGKIIAVPDRYPGEWVLTLCRPEER
jgi:hypothetical protein